METPKKPLLLQQTQLNPYFSCCHYYNVVPHNFGFHQHPFYEIDFFLSGDMSYTVEGRTYRLHPGDLLLVNPGNIHRLEIATCKPSDHYVLWVYPEFFERTRTLDDSLSACFSDAVERRYELFRPEGPIMRQLKRLCGQIMRSHPGEDVGGRALSCAYLTEFLVYLNRAYLASPQLARCDITENEKINRVVAYINDHLTEHLSLDQLGSTFYISKFHLNRLFKEYTGLPLYQFIIKKRLALARAMLAAGTPVMDACLKCGFSDYSNFLKAFKREYGGTPRTFISQA